MRNMLGSLLINVFFALISSFTLAMMYAIRYIRNRDLLDRPSQVGKEREREGVKRAKRKRGCTCNSLSSHVIADAPILLWSTDFLPAPRRITIEPEKISYRAGCGEMTRKIGANAPL